MSGLLTYGESVSWPSNPMEDAKSMRNRFTKHIHTPTPTIARPLQSPPSGKRIYRSLSNINPTSAQFPLRSYRSAGPRQRRLQLVPAHTVILTSTTSHAGLIGGFSPPIELWTRSQGKYVVPHSASPRTSHCASTIYGSTGNPGNCAFLSTKASTVWTAEGSGRYRD